MKDRRESDEQVKWDFVSPEMDVHVPKGKVSLPVESNEESHGAGTQPFNLKMDTALVKAGEVYEEAIASEHAEVRAK